MARPSTCLTLIVAGLGLALASAGTAAAAPGPCTGKIPAAGASVHGPVLHVVDGETLCVALGATPDQWVALRLADGPQAGRPSPDSDRLSRGVLMAVAFSQNVTCRMVAADPDEGEAVCDLDGRSVGERIRDADAVRSGSAWR